MTLPAAHCIDESEEFYSSCGVSRGNKNGFLINSLSNGDIIFVKTDFIYNGKFQLEILPLIKTDFILVTGVSSFSIDEGNNPYLNILNHPKLIKWFCTNPPTKAHSKLVGLPIGFEEVERPGGNTTTLNEFYDNHLSWGDKKDKIYIPYHTNTFAGRNETIAKLSKLAFVDVEPNRLSFKDYLNKMNKYKFILSLRGAGWDCHRHYESLLVGSVPIMDGGPILNFFKVNSLPVLDVSEISDQIFNKSYNFLYVKDFLTMEYHFNKINNKL
tara:strand:+ start:926 stop:1735 length:810 start_codon:yes stop_codon:yes gene_type:complete